MANEILNMELSEDDESLLRESLVTWKEGVYADLLEKVEEVKAAKIEELEEANAQYQSELKESFAHKMVMALDEMRSELRAEVISEMVASNPEIQILEKIKELIAPTLNEEYYGNVYAEELAIDEGASTLAELISPYSEKTQNIILALIKEGNAEEVTEQFYELIESLGAIEESDDEDMDEDMDEDEEEDDEEYDDEESDEEDMDEDSNEESDSYINEDSDDSFEEPKKNTLKNQIAGLAK